MNALSSVKVFVLDPCLPLNENMECKELLIFIFTINTGIDSLPTWVQPHVDYPQEALGSDLKPHGQLANQF